MQIYRRFLPVAVMVLAVFSVASSLRAQGVDDSNATRSADLNSVLQADSSRCGPQSGSDLGRAGWRPVSVPK